MKNILLLSNTENSDPEEDQFLAEYLRKEYRVTLAHPSYSRQFEESADLILIRNIWPIEHSRRWLLHMYQRLNVKNKKTYNHFSGNGDMNGKEYLARLFQKGYQVIPSIDRLNLLSMLPKTRSYMIKPKYGGSGTGIEKLRQEELEKVDFNQYIVQPFLDIAYEASAYFIDGQLQYTLRTKTPANRWNLITYRPRHDEIQLVETFARWNTLKYGIMRIDFCRTNEGNLFLMEIEDWCPYLSLLEISLRLRNKFLRSLSVSIRKIL